MSVSLTTKSQVINDYFPLSKSHAPSVLQILNGFCQHKNQEWKLRLKQVLRTNNIIKGDEPI